MRTLAGALCLLMAAVADAQSGCAWREPASGVEADLHGAMWTGRQWLVMGEAGLVLRSSDGSAWSASCVGGANLYAAIGKGTERGWGGLSFPCRERPAASTAWNCKRGGSALHGGMISLP